MAASERLTVGLTDSLTHLGDGLHRADVGVGPQQDVLQLGFLLVHPLHRQLAAGLLGHLHLAVGGLLRGDTRCESSPQHFDNKGFLVPDSSPRPWTWWSQRAADQEQEVDYHYMKILILKVIRRTAGQIKDKILIIFSGNSITFFCWFLFL